MRTAGNSAFNLGPRLVFTFVMLIVLILGGNALVVWQFQMTSNEAARLTGANQQLIAVLRLQAILLSYHRRLDDLARSMDMRRLVTEAKSLRGTLRQQTQQITTAIASLPSGTVVDPSFLPTIDAIDITLPAEVEAIVELAKSGDWGDIRPRLDNELNPIETQAAILVNSINQQASEELERGIAEMKSTQRRILVIVPATALSTFLTATFFGWSIARRLIELRLDERVAERTRIARELHDTLLQNFHGLMFQFQAARNLLPRRVDEAVHSLDDAINEAEKALAESRGAIQDLRSEPMAEGNLAELLMSTSRELTNSNANEHPPVFDLIEEGERQALSSTVSTEVCRIALELMRNAYQHAHAQRIEAEIRYDDYMFRLRIRDNGKGIDPNVLEEGGRTGHWGLRGVRERTDRIGAQLDVWSESGSGTEVQLLVPASIAYESRGDSYRAKLVGKVKRSAQRS